MARYLCYTFRAKFDLFLLNISQRGNHLVTYGVIPDFSHTQAWMVHVYSVTLTSSVLSEKGVKISMGLKIVQT